MYPEYIEGPGSLLEVPGGTWGAHPFSVVPGCGTHWRSGERVLGLGARPFSRTLDRTGRPRGLGPVRTIYSVLPVLSVLQHRR